MKMNKPRLLLPVERLPVFENLIASEVKKLLIALMRYQYFDEQPSGLSDKLQGIFLVMQSDADADARKYSEKCEKNRRNAKTRSQKSSESK